MCKMFSLTIIRFDRFFYAEAFVFHIYDLQKGDIMAKN